MISPAECEELHKRLILLGADLWLFCAKLPQDSFEVESFRALLREIVALTDLCKPQQEELVHE